MKLSAVIPTKNRPDELQVAAASILAQRRRPDELIIVDQSASEDGRRRLEALMRDQGQGIALQYVHDTSIQGLVHAKQVASRIAGGDVVCFLEDDEVLEPGYFEEIERGFRDNPEMLGCCGLVTNLPPLPAGYVPLFHLFHRGMFRDPRVGVHGYVKGENLPLIESDYLSGGLSCWRREVLAKIPFDVDNGFHMLEDIDFSTRAAREYGHRFRINPNARLEHRMSPVNREVLGPRERRKLREFLLFYKKRAAQPWALLQLAWLLVGLLLEALWQSLRALSLAPFAAYFAGIADGVRARLKGNAL
jgi:GT2 family glycosyltransferase